MPSYHSYPGSYHPEYQYYTFPPSAPVVPNYLGARSVLPPPRSYGTTVTSFVRPFTRDLPRVSPEPWEHTESNHATTHRVVTRPLIAKSRIDTTDTVYAGPKGRNLIGPREQPRRPTMDSPTRTQSGKKRKSSEGDDHDEVKPDVDRLSEIPNASSDAQIIPGVALHGSSTFSTTRPTLTSRPSGSNVSLSSSPGRTTTTTTAPAFPTRQSVTPRAFPVVSNGTINPNARGLGGDGQGPVFTDTGETTTENGQDKLKRKKPRVALSCAQCTKVILGVEDCGPELMRCAEKAKM